MHNDARQMARTAGALYLVIIVCGLWGELFVRGSIIQWDDASVTAANILDRDRLFRFGFVADSLMAVCDGALAVLLYIIFKPVSAALALMAAVFRLLQTAVIGFNLLNQHAALLILGNGERVTALGSEQSNAMALQFLDMQSHGYDLGLIFFGVSSVITGWLIWSSGFIPRPLGALIALAGCVYVIGSYLLFLAPIAHEAFQPAYAICLIGELAFCMWLLVRAPTPAGEVS